MKYAITILGLALSVSATQAVASGFTCASSDGRLSYTYWTSDGGPAVRGPAVSLVLDGKKLIAITAIGPQDPLVLGSIEFVGSPQNPVSNKNGNVIVTTYQQEAKVTSDGALLFDETVPCQATKYVGPPIP